MRLPISPRWLIFFVFVFSSTLNYLDRMILAALAPLLKAEFHLTNTDFGLILAAFSITYAAAAPPAGLLIDRIGLNLGISIAVAFWSAAGIATAFVKGLPGLVGCRAALGLAEAGGVPATGKSIANYLRPEERALGNAVSQMGLGIGAMLAPPVAVWLAVRYGWRSAFLISGAAGLLWIPVWNWVARTVPRETPPKSPPLGSGQVFRDRRLWGFVIANVLSMTAYTLWTNWTTIFLAQEHRLTVVEAAWYAWIPPVFFNLGGLFGGWLALRWMKCGLAAIPVRMRVCLASAIALLATAAVPWVPSAGWATAAICVSAFWSSSMSVNLYSMPLDIYGARHAAFAVSMLTSAYGAMQALFSPLIGRLIDLYGFGPVCTVSALLPLAGYVTLRKSLGRG